MNSVVFGITIGLILSIDAFVLSLLYGTTFKRKRDSLLTSIIVGFFHFFMPYLGYIMAYLTLRNIELNTKLIASIIFLILGLLMIIQDENNKNTIKICSTIGKIIFAFSVSIDSFMVGISFEFLEVNILTSAFIFSIISASITLIGLSLGKTARDRFSHIPLEKIAGIGMLFISIITFINYVLK